MTVSISKRRANVAVVIVRVIFISFFLCCCLFYNLSFQTNPNSVTYCFKLFSLLQLTTTFAQCVRLIFETEYNDDSSNGESDTMETSLIGSEHTSSSSTSTSSSPSSDTNLGSTGSTLGYDAQDYPNRMELPEYDAGEYLSGRERVHRVYGSTVVDISIPSPSFQTCFIVFVTFSSI